MPVEPTTEMPFAACATARVPFSGQTRVARPHAEGCRARATSLPEARTPVTFRHLLSWKSLFYGTLLPALGSQPAARGDAVLGSIGRAGWCLPARRREMIQAVSRAREALGADWPVEETARGLAANVPRFLARDCLLGPASDEELAGRFDVTGLEHLEAATAGGRGAILLGCHLGSHLAGVHWLLRRDHRLRLLVQRPSHVSERMRAFFDAEGPLPQSRLFLKRDLTPGQAAERLLAARSALRAGHAVYLNGDIPWAGPNSHPGRLLGQRRDFLGVWADLAVLARVPVVAMFCTHLPNGRHRLHFHAPWTIQSGGEAIAVKRYLEQLEAEIAAHPADAVAHLLWPCYSEPTPRRRRSLSPLSSLATPDAA